MEEAEDNGIKCQFCERTFPQKKTIIQHCRSAHENDIKKCWIVCTECKEYYIDVGAYYNHKSRDRCYQTNQVNPIKRKRAPETDVTGLESDIKNQPNVSKKQPDVLENSVSQLYVCQVCNKSYQTKDNLSRHCRLKHVTGLESDIKNQPNVSKKQPDVSQLYACQVCNKSYQTKDHLSRHCKLKHSENIQKPNHGTVNLCLFCTKTFTTRVNMLRHCRVNHPKRVKATWIKCEICPQHLIDKRALKIHKERNLCTRAINKNQECSDDYSCQFCNQTLTTRELMIRHCRLTHPKRVKATWIKCEICPRPWYLIDKRALEIHKKRNFCTRVITYNKKKVVAKKMKLLKCQFCSETFRNAKTMYKHAREAHLDLIVDKWQNCTNCMLMFPTARSLHNHVTQCDHKCYGFKPEYKCQYCNKMFKDFRLLLLHCNIKHPNQKTTQCQFCVKQSINSKSFYMHVRSKHPNEIMACWIKCLQCDLRFPDSSAVTTHMSKNCKQSKNRAEQDFHNKTIMPTATAKKTKCNFCTQNFSTIKAYYIHARTDHATLLAKHWIKCSQCHKYYPDSKVLLNHHMKKVCNYRKNKITTPVTPQAMCNEVKQTSKVTVNGMQCQFCHQRFPHWGKMYKHAREKHPNDVNKHWIKCSKCPKSYPDEKSVKQHELLRTCTSNYPDDKSLKKQKTKECDMSIDSTDKSIELDQDGVSDSSDNSIISVIDDNSVDEGGDSSDNSIKGLFAKSGLVRIICDFCSIIFLCTDGDDSNQQKYLDHANKEHPEELCKKWIKCGTCDFHAPDQKIIDAHENQCYCPGVCIQCDAICTNINIHTCSHGEQKNVTAKEEAIMICDKTMCSKCGELVSDIDKHVETCRLNSNAKVESITICDNCDESFQSNKSFNDHRKDCKNMCSKCGELVSDIDKHVETCRLNSRTLCNVHCNNCDQYFATSKDHEQTCTKCEEAESKNNLAQCDLCNDYFESKTLIEHKIHCMLNSMM
jgi:hypothetical protein